MDFGDALKASVIAGMDPMNGMMRSLMASTIREKSVVVDGQVMDNMDRLRKAIEEMKSAGSDQKIIDAYQRMLDNYTK
jgi:hypothetical protein